MEFKKEFKGETYKEWFEYYSLVSSPAITKALIENFPNVMFWGKLKDKE